MGDVIHPAFGRPQPQSAGPGDPLGAFTHLQSYGEKAGLVVGLVRFDGGAEPTALGVLVGPAGGTAAVAVATLPDTPEGEAEAETVGLAIIRTLMVLDGSFRPWETEPT